ncbi:MAG TPA: FAD-dependent monooxygenase [Actinophytocola sp.]|jgi:2-polyprenyl-6-methoxyphenol hydroxylase-like FAD-dependent oxidoreductase|uniref:FAD-dependent monooxygenase n=1 Tax=Actinophytocola sp. TaxID=1872138 RepID=UPI002F95904E
MAERTAVIVGGGIGGLATAAGLRRHGWTVRVLERADAFTEVGAGISLWPNAFTALATIGVTGVGDERIGVAGGLRDWRGRWIVRMHDTEQAARHTGSAVVAHRAELLDALLAAVPAECRQAGVAVRGVRHAARRGGHRAVVEHDGAGGGGELAADLVVGADGLRSVVRESLWPDAKPPVYSGHTAWRIVMPRPSALDGAGVRAWAETWGPGGVFGLFPMPGGRVYCYATATVPPGGQGGLAELRERFRGWCDPIPAVLAAAEPEHVLRNDIYYLPRLRTFVDGPVVLLGDAAHAMTPNLGQGGCQALEDAATLSALAGSPDLAGALRRYDELRRPRTQELWQRSKQGGTLSHLTPAPARAVRNALLRMLPRSLFLKSLARPFSWQPPAAEVDIAAK